MERTLLQFFDQDGSGFITCDEMVDQFAELGGLLSPDEIHKFHSVLDRDGNGVIDVSIPWPCLPCPPYPCRHISVLVNLQQRAFVAVINRAHKFPIVQPNRKHISETLVAPYLMI